MGTVHIPDHLKQVIDRHIADGCATSEADYVEDALRA
jgi:Arc/MetJ-type ribon-helix-helix transcriptional regulator